MEVGSTLDTRLQGWRDKCEGECGETSVIGNNEVEATKSTTTTVKLQLVEKAKIMKSTTKMEATVYLWKWAPCRTQGCKGERGSMRERGERQLSLATLREG